MREVHFSILDIHVSVSKGGSMTSELLSEYMQHVLRCRPGAIFNSPCLIVMDSATCHDVSKIPMDKNVHVVKVIPIHSVLVKYTGM